MTTHLEKPLKRELTIDGRAYSLIVSPEGLKLTLKGRRNGQELRWADLVSGDAALAVALNASLHKFSVDPPPVGKGESAVLPVRRRKGANRARDSRARSKRR